MTDPRTSRTASGSKRTEPLQEAIDKLRAGKALSSRDMTLLSTRPSGIVALMQRGLIQPRGGSR